LTRTTGITYVDTDGGNDEGEQSGMWGGKIERIIQDPEDNMLGGRVLERYIREGNNQRNTKRGSHNAHQCGEGNIDDNLDFALED